MTGYNLDDVQEYFEFILGGHTYRFLHLSVEEVEKWQDIASKEDQKEKAMEYLFSFITSEDESAPKFTQVQKTMTIPKIHKFYKMLEAEFSGNVSR